jgi:hypothetical protein
MNGGTRLGTSRALLTFGVAALVLAALVTVIGQAQAAPSTKNYDAFVRLTNAAGPNGSSTFTLTLTNETKSKQVIGSANFTAPPNFTVPNSSQTITPNGHTWTVASDGSAVVTFRAASGGDSLNPGETVSASVVTQIPSSCTPQPGDGGTSAFWTTQAKQSNDFSGQPGNDSTINPQASDLQPLGSFSIAAIQTIKDGQPIPAIYTNQQYPSTTTAYDTCGNVKTNYTGATRTQTFLTGAGFTPSSGLSWSNGVGTVTITPAVTETGNNITVTDAATAVTATSNSFDVSDTLCTSTDTQPCEWKGGKNAGIIAHADPPPPDANLGIGFNSSVSSPPRASFSCDGGSTPVGDAVVNINPRGYPTGVPFTVSLTYKKSISGNGSANAFVVCISDDGATGSWTTAPACTNPVTATPCVQTQKRVTGGDLLIVLYVTQGDPWGGIKS